MQFGPDNVPVSTQSVIIGPPLLAPAPVPVTTTITEIGPLRFDPGPTLIDEPTNVRVTEPYAVAVSYQGSQVTSKVTDLNFAGTGVSAINSAGIVTITVNGIAAGTGISIVSANNVTTVTNTFTETVYQGGNATGNLTPDRNNGTIQKFTLTGNITLNPPANMTAGQSLTLILTQDSPGNRDLTASSSYLFAGAFTTLSNGAGEIDMLNIFYDGTVYYVTLTVGYTNA
jgi:hypothetical protein